MYFCICLILLYYIFLSNYLISGKLKTLQHSVPYSAKIAGVLQELKDDIVKETQLNHMAGGQYVIL